LCSFASKNISWPKEMIAWRRILPSLLGLCITASGAEGKLQGGQASSVPFFAWAPRQGSYFVQGREPKISATGKDIASQISGLKSSTRPAEVVVLFTFSKMGSSHFNRLLAVGQGLNFLQAGFITVVLLVSEGCTHPYF